MGDGEVHGMEDVEAEGVEDSVDEDVAVPVDEESIQTPISVSRYRRKWKKR